MKHEDYLLKAFDKAFEGVRNNVGGPFGAIIVKDEKILSIACNQVTSNIDPTAHAEIVAIRKACIELNNFNLFGATLYSTCEPCPMCLGAIYWARIKTVYYCLSRIDAERIGFADNHIHNELGTNLEKSSLEIIQIQLPIANDLFKEWTDKGDKVEY